MKKYELSGDILTTELAFPEGPIAMPDGSVLVVEIMGETLKRVTSDGTVSVVATLGGGPNGAAMGPDGHCYVCNNGGFTWRTDNGFSRPTGAAEGYKGGYIQRVDIQTGHIEVLYSECDGMPLHGPNDIVFDQQGGFYFTDFGKKHDDRLMLGSLYYATTDGQSIRCIARHLLTPNGVGLSPDEQTVYVSETETARVWRYPVRGQGQVATEPWPSPNGGQFVFGGKGYQRFDSMAIEADGNICVATLVNGGISVISPDGEMLEFHQAPESYCTNICFGGPDMTTAYITLSGNGHLMAVDWPRPGLSLNI